MTTDTALALLAEAEDAICILSDSIRDGTVSEYYSNLCDRITALLQREMDAENAEPVAWMNPENGVVIDARQKQQIGEGSGYPKFSIPLYTAIDRARSANDKG